MIKLSLKRTLLTVVGTVFVILPAAPVFASSGQPIISNPLFLPRERNTSSSTTALGKSTSENWSGYAATGANNSFTSISSSWIQPSLTCASNSNAYSASWVGLDGYSDQTVEQIGTEANCNGGQAQYYTWYEMYPQNYSEVLVRLNISPGDKVTASVVYNPSQPVSRGHFRGFTTNNGSFTLSIIDNTTGLSYSTTQTSNRSAYRSSAEVIEEAPYSNGILPLANFGTINYTNSLVNGAALGNAAGLQSITMDDPHGMVATPSSLDTTGENFSVTWSS